MCESKRRCGATSREGKLLSPCLCACPPAAAALSVHMCVLSAPLLDQQVDELGCKPPQPRCCAALVLTPHAVSRRDLLCLLVHLESALAVVVRVVPAPLGVPLVGGGVAVVDGALGVVARLGGRATVLVFLSCCDASGASWAIWRELLQMSALPSGCRLHVDCRSRTFPIPRKLSCSNAIFSWAVTISFIDARTRCKGPTLRIPPDLMLGALRGLRCHRFCGISGASVQEVVSCTTTDTELACAALVEKLARYSLVMQPIAEGAGVLKASHANSDVVDLLECRFDSCIPCEL